MQQSSALRKVDDYNSAVVTKPSEQEPQFGQRPNPKAKPVTPTVPVVRHVVEERVIRLKTPEETEEEKFASKAPPPLSLYHTDGFKQQVKPLVPTIFNDILSNIFTYLLILALTTLAVFKVYQVQMTRDMTAKYNEVKLYNESLHRQWLSLLSDRAALTEYTIIRNNASTNLEMVQPKTEDEVVIDLR